jgi:hypothetical protein
LNFSEKVKFLKDVKVSCRVETYTCFSVAWKRALPMPIVAIMSHRMLNLFSKRCLMALANPIPASTIIGTLLTQFQNSAGKED